MLETRKNWRGAANRYYYVAFSIVTHELRRRVRSFPRGYEHPPHNQIGRYVKKYLTQFSKQDRDELRDALKRLYEVRVEADYRHQARITAADTRDARVDALYVMRTIGVLF